MPDHPTTSAERLKHIELPGRADADIAPSRERYYPLDRPLPGALEEDDRFTEPTVDDLMAGPVAPYSVELPDTVGETIPGHPCPVCFQWECEHRLAPVSQQPITDLEELFREPATALPTSALARKMLPMATGLLDYFPAALVAVAGLSKVGNEQHNPGQPLHWARGKSGDEGDALIRHFIERGSLDTDGIRHSTKVAWRALALLQKELEEAGAPLSRGSR